MVFQRSFAEDGDYENEGFVTFTTKDNGIPTTVVVLSTVVGLLVLMIVVGGIVMWRRLHPDSNGECIFYVFADCFDTAFGNLALLFQLATFQKQLNLRRSG